MFCFRIIFLIDLVLENPLKKGSNKQKKKKEIIVNEVLYCNFCDSKC